MPDPVRIFIGAAPSNEDLESQAVLEFSLRKHASLPLDIHWMQLSRDPESLWYSDPSKRKGWNTIGWTTPFSGFRFAIPHACNFEGKAIYMDSDMIVLADIAELWGQPFQNGSPVISKGKNHPRYCVSLFDCAAMKSYVHDFETLRTHPIAYMQIRSRIMPGTQPFVGNWNVCDGEHYKSLSDPDIKILHYTSIPHQLQLKHSLPRLKAEGAKHWYTGKTQPHWKPGLQEMFDTLLEEAIANGYPPEKYRREPFGDYRIKWAA